MADLDDPRTLAVPADATVHLRRADEARVTVDDFGPGAPTVAVMRQSWQGAMRSLADLGEQVRRLMAERDRLAEAYDRVDAVASRWAKWGAEEPGVSATYAVAARVVRSALSGPEPDAPAGPPSEPVAAQKPPAVDTVSGASKRREGER